MPETSKLSLFLEHLRTKVLLLEVENADVLLVVAIVAFVLLAKLQHEYYKWRELQIANVEKYEAMALAFKNRKKQVEEVLEHELDAVLEETASNETGSVDRELLILDELLNMEKELTAPSSEASQEEEEERKQDRQDLNTTIDSLDQEQLMAETQPAGPLSIILPDEFAANQAPSVQGLLVPLTPSSAATPRTQPRINVKSIYSGQDHGALTPRQTGSFAVLAVAGEETVPQDTETMSSSKNLPPPSPSFLKAVPKTPLPKEDKDPIMSCLCP